MRTDPKARSPTTAIKEHSPRRKHKCQSGASLTKKKKKNPLPSWLPRSISKLRIFFVCFGQRNATPCWKKASAKSPAGLIKSYHETFKGFSLTAEPLQPFCSNWPEQQPETVESVVTGEGEGLPLATWSSITKQTGPIFRSPTSWRFHDNCSPSITSPLRADPMELAAVRSRVSPPSAFLYLAEEETRRPRTSQQTTCGQRIYRTGINMRASLKKKKNHGPCQTCNPWYAFAPKEGTISYKQILTLHSPLCRWWDDLLERQILIYVFSPPTKSCDDAHYTFCSNAIFKVVFACDPVYFRYISGHC